MRHIGRTKINGRRARRACPGGPHGPHRPVGHARRARRPFILVRPMCLTHRLEQPAPLTCPIMSRPHGPHARGSTCGPRGAGGPSGPWGSTRTCSAAASSLGRGPPAPPAEHGRLGGGAQATSARCTVTCTHCCRSGHPLAATSKLVILVYRVACRAQHSCGGLYGVPYKLFPYCNMHMYMYCSPPP